MKKDNYLASIKKVAIENNKAIAAQAEAKRNIEKELLEANALMKEATNSGNQEKHTEAEHKLSFLESRRRALEDQEAALNLSEGMKIYESVNSEYIKEKDSLIAEMEKLINDIFKKLDDLEALESDHVDILSALVEIIPVNKKAEINNSYMMWELPKFRKFAESFMLNLSDIPNNRSLFGWLELFKG